MTTNIQILINELIMAGESKDLGLSVSLKDCQSEIDNINNVVTTIYQDTKAIEKGINHISQINKSIKDRMINF